MTAVANPLVLVGSPRGPKSASARLARCLTAGFAAPDGQVHELFLTPALKTTARREELLRAVDAADLLILAAPVYVDSLPAPVIGVLEYLAEHWRDQTPGAKGLALLVNCGFPEAAHCATALRIGAQFARETGLAWRGGLAIGGGGAIAGLLDDPAPARPGKPARELVLALAEAGAALGAGLPIPDALVERVARPVFPHRLYTFMATLGWHIEAWGQRAWHRLGWRPYPERGPTS